MYNATYNKRFFFIPANAIFETNNNNQKGLAVQQNNLSSLGEVIHKKKKQKKYNKTNGQIDNLKGYQTPGKSSTDKMATDDKQIRREANYLKNIHIDESLKQLTAAGLVNEGYEAWYCKCMHTLGVPYVMAQADVALHKGSNPQALFHFLINKAMNKHVDPFMPRFNTR